MESQLKAVRVYFSPCFELGTISVSEIMKSCVQYKYQNHRHNHNLLFSSTPLCKYVGTRAPAHGPTEHHWIWAFSVFPLPVMYLLNYLMAGSRHY